MGSWYVLVMCHPHRYCCGVSISSFPMLTALCAVQGLSWATALSGTCWLWVSPEHFVQSDSQGVHLVQATLIEKVGMDNAIRIIPLSPSSFSPYVVWGLGGKAVLYSYQMDVVLMRNKGVIPGQGMDEVWSCSIQTNSLFPTGQGYDILVRWVLFCKTCLVVIPSASANWGLV